MLIDIPGKYTTREGKTVSIVRIDRTTAIGRFDDNPEPLVWELQTGDAIGHSLGNSITGRQRNLPMIANQITQILGGMDDNFQRQTVLNIVRQQICFDCGSVSGAGRKCACQQPKQTNPRGKPKQKTVH